MRFGKYAVFILCILWIFFLSPGCETETPSPDSTPDTAAPMESTTKRIGPEGGSIVITDPESPIFGARADIPEGALSNDTDITIAYVRNPENPPSDILPAGSTIDFLPDGISFSKYVDIYLPYHDDDNNGFIDRSTIAEDTIRAIFYNDLSGLWQDLSVIGQDTENNLLHLRTLHFSRYSAVSYLTKLCKEIAPLTYGPYYFSLFYNYRFKPFGFRASVSDVGADLNVSNAELMDLNSAKLEYDGFKDLYDRILDATIWTWVWEVNEDLTYLSLKAGLEVEEVVTEIKATGPTTLEFSWNFDYDEMAPSEMMVVTFYGMTDKLCTLMDRTPRAPGNLYITGVTDTSIGLEWDEVVNIYGDVMYNVYMSLADEGFNTILTFDTNSTTITGLSPSTTYRFKVTTTYENNLESGDSNTVSTTTDAAD